MSLPGMPSIQQAFATPENFAKLEEIERITAELKEEADAMQDCGVDCQMFRTIADQFQRDTAAFRKRFFDRSPEL